MNTQSTAARVHSSNAAHFYTRTGMPMHWVDRSDGMGMRPTTLRDARKLGLLPSPTSILKVLNSPPLNAYWIEQACLAVLTAPKMAGEELDAFVHRVLQVEKQQSDHAQAARQLGTDIHGGVEQVLTGHACPVGLSAYVMPAVELMREKFGSVRGTERVVVGDRCAGRLDSWFVDAKKQTTLVDIKTTGNPPTKGSWLEHRMQLSFYAKALPLAISDQTANVYISTQTPGVVVVDTHADWATTYEDGFLPLLNYWYFANNYNPSQP